MPACGDAATSRAAALPTRHRYPEAERQRRRNSLDRYSQYTSTKSSSHTTSTKCQYHVVASNAK